MYEIMKRRLERGGYTIEDATGRLHYLVAEGELKPAQAEELAAVAAEHADTPHPLESQVASLQFALDNAQQALRWLLQNVVPNDAREGLLEILGE